MAVGYEVILHQIECKKLNEDGDEIYYRVNGLDQRPLRVPDYWLFENVGQIRRIHRLVLDGPEGAQALFSIMEQDGGLRFEHDAMGELWIKVVAGVVTFEPKTGTTYVGVRRGYHVVDFHDSDGVYAAHFLARRVETQ